MAFTLGDLERTVLDAVRHHGLCSTRDVLLDLQKGREIAYTTVATTLDRLHAKQLLQRKRMRGKGGPHYVYQVSPSTALQKKSVSEAVSRLVDVFGPGVVTSIYDELNALSGAELEQLKRRAKELREA